MPEYHVGAHRTRLSFEVFVQVEWWRLALSGLSTTVDGWSAVIGVIGSRQVDGDEVDDENEEQGHA